MRQVDVVFLFKVEAFESAQERFVFDLVLRRNVNKIKKNSNIYRIKSILRKKNFKFH